MWHSLMNGGCGYPILPPLSNVPGEDVGPRGTRCVWVRFAAMKYALAIDSVKITPSTTPIKEHYYIPNCKMPSDTYDDKMYRVLQLLKRAKKVKKKPTPVTGSENKTNSVGASKFWRTSPLQISNPTTMWSSDSPKSMEKADGATVNDFNKLSSVECEPEPMI
ncbi:hypothetical protein AVEN_85406-1 [Araneus ventricosus]|uniref:Uncharacterized protein n=1 Tax=Araneus ventricosus TaxID=182803 RepID=A0A4Y2FIK4_ARAVE|nr:hypothetical protein AVEN_85406-1 [Araneus ventricosus]